VLGRALFWGLVGHGIATQSLSEALTGVWN
jgi:hypothetical protein